LLTKAGLYSILRFVSLGYAAWYSQVLSGKEASDASRFFFGNRLSKVIKGLSW
jgi:hypothetical protein